MYHYKPIEISGLSEDECIDLIRTIQGQNKASYKDTAISISGDKGLKRIAQQTLYKPLLIESVIKYISHTKSSIDTALDTLFSKNNTELLEFLYEDAWQRMSNDHKKIFMVLININSLINEITLPFICQKFNIQTSDFQTSLSETHFTVVEDKGASYNVELVKLAKQFFWGKFREDSEIIEIAQQTDDYYKIRMKIEEEYVQDRVISAFKSPYARAAKVAVTKGDYPEAIKNYDLAIEEDPLNSHLYDRYACFLLQQNIDLPNALKLSKKSVELNDSNADALVTLGLIYYRLDQIKEGDIYIQQAKNNGRDSSFCYLEQAIARYYSARRKFKQSQQPGDAISMLKEASTYLAHSEKSFNQKKSKKNINKKIDIFKTKIITLKQNIMNAYAK